MLISIWFFIENQDYARFITFLVKKIGFVLLNRAISVNINWSSNENYEDKEKILF